MAVFLDDDEYLKKGEVLSLFKSVVQLKEKLTSLRHIRFVFKGVEAVGTFGRSLKRYRET